MSPFDFQLIFLILFALLALFLKLKGKVLGLLNAEAEPLTPKALRIYTALTLALSALIFLLSLFIILLIVDIRSNGIPGRSGDGGAGYGIGMFAGFVWIWLSCAAGISLVLNFIQLGAAYYFKSRKQKRLGWISVALLLPLIAFDLYFVYEAHYSAKARREAEDSSQRASHERYLRHARAIYH